MERLTERYVTTDNEKIVWMYQHDYIGVSERLADYEDTGLTPEQIRELKERGTAKAPVQFGDEDEPMLRCPYCDENVTDLMECGFTFCPYCGKRWYGK